MRDTIRGKGLAHFDNVVAQFIGQLCLMNQATTKSFLIFALCFLVFAFPGLTQIKIEIFVTKCN